MKRFHNPYHFVPVASRPEGRDVAWTTVAQGQSANVRHDRYASKTRSGRLLCRLVAETPFFVGAKRTRDASENHPAEVAGFELGGDPAIPASSLRGLISNIAEAASNSALRVLDNQCYSYRWHRQRMNIKDRPHDFFAEVDPNLPPLMREGPREKLTPAEMLFGFVEGGKQETAEEGDQDERELARALAGRLRFSHALYQGLQTSEDSALLDKAAESRLGEVTLKILDTPKPPCPPLYFRHKNPKDRSWIAKRDLSLNEHRPLGRKFYLHQHWSEDEAQKPPCETEHEEGREARLKQKVRIRPLRKGTTFQFFIDFDNLDDDELGMLLYALRPTPSFRHKLGMGKPIGLGTVRIDPLALFCIDRQRRYTAGGLSAKRYHTRWIWGGSAELEGVQEFFKQTEADAEEIEADALRQSFREQMNPGIRNALELLGDPASIAEAVHYPRKAASGDAETKLYEWFVENEKVRQERLAPLDGWSEDTLPTLIYLAQNKR